MDDVGRITVYHQTDGLEIISIFVLHIFIQKRDT